MMCSSEQSAAAQETSRTSPARDMAFAWTPTQSLMDSLDARRRLPIGGVLLD